MECWSNLCRLVLTSVDNRCIYFLNDVILALFGRTELIISVSKANCYVEVDGEIHLSLNPEKPNEKCQKLFLRIRFFAKQIFPALKNETSGIV